MSGRKKKRDDFRDIPARCFPTQSIHPIKVIKGTVQLHTALSWPCMYILRAATIRKKELILGKNGWPSYTYICMYEQVNVKQMSSSRSI